MKSGEEYDIKTVPFFTNIPINTIKLEIIATVMDDEGKVFKVSTKATTKDVREGMTLGEEWESENVTYHLTDFGRGVLNNIQ